MDEQRPKKRKLSDAQSNEQPVLPSLLSQTEGTVKRGGVWFEDGNVILQAEHTQFRVHKSIISACSSVFKSMFSLPQTPYSESDAEGDGIHDGCDVVHLHDSAEDLHILLKGIYHHPNSGLTPTADVVCITFKALSALLRLGNKYDVAHLRDNAICRLRAEYAPTYGNLKFERTVYFSDRDPGMDFDLVSLAYQEGVFSVLPLSLYVVAVTYETKTIFDGDKRADGTQATLPPDMQRACIEGREKLADRLGDLVYKWMIEEQPTPNSCRSRRICSAFFSSLKEKIWEPTPNLMYTLRYDWKYITSDSNLSLCRDCELKSRKRHGEARKALWEQLPSIFGYGSWKEVNRMDRH